MPNFLQNSKTALFGEDYDDTEAEMVWNKLSNVLIFASLSKAASAYPRPLITPLTASQLEHPRLIFYL